MLYQLSYTRIDMFLNIIPGEEKASAVIEKKR